MLPGKRVSDLLVPGALASQGWAERGHPAMRRRQQQPSNFLAEFRDRLEELTVRMDGGPCTAAVAAGAWVPRNGSCTGETGFVSSMAIDNSNTTTAHWIDRKLDIYTKNF